MSQDGKPQVIPKQIINDRPITNEVDCPCGGRFYAAPSARYARCSNGEFRCKVCRRLARRFGKGYTCGSGCTPYKES